MISSLAAYEKFWIGWWTSLQPSWRHSDVWPLPRGPIGDGKWDELLVGGKDGLFVVVMALSWWIGESAKTPGEGFGIMEAIADVSWVLSNLVSVLSDGDDGQSGLSHTPASTSTEATRGPHNVRIGPPAKRARIR